MRRYRKPGLASLSLYSGGYCLLEKVKRQAVTRIHWRLYWLSEGGLTFRHADQSRRLEPDEILLVPPNTPVRKELTHPVLHFYLHFNLGIPYDFLSGKLFFLPLNDHLANLLDRLVELSARSNEELRGDLGFELVLEAFVFSTLIELPPDEWPPLPADSRIAAALQTIEEDLVAEKDNAALAATANMSVNAFIRLFKQQVGKSPQAYAMERRLQKAAIHLLHTEETVETIAEQCGFCDRAHFSRTFKSKYGIGPGRYRREASA